MLLNLFRRLQETTPGEATTSPGGAPPSLEDTIAKAYDALEARGSEADQGTELPEVTEADQDPEPDAGSRARGPDGKFAKAATEVSDAGKGSDDSGAQQTPPVETPATKFADPPKSWRGPAKAEWSKVPEALRDEIYKREEDNFRGLEQYKGNAQRFEALHAVIAPHAEIFQQSGQNAIENIGGLLNLQKALYTGDDNTKLGTLLQIATNVGIKPEAIQQALANGWNQPVQDPRLDAVMKRLEQSEARFSELQRAPIMSQVESFLADPKNEFASDPAVQARMQIELMSGGAKSMQEAYDNACKLVPSVTQTLEQRKREADAKEREAKAKEDAKRKADLAAKAAKAASINVRPRGVTTGTSAKKGTLEETIGATWDAIAARGGG
jgi:hypothetical protein